MSTKKKTTLTSIETLRNNVMTKLAKLNDRDFFSFITAETGDQVSVGTIGSIMNDAREAIGLLDTASQEQVTAFCKDLVTLLKKHKISVQDFEEIYEDNSAYELLQAGGIK